MDYKEEQAQELDILRSIYPDELDEISETKFNIHFALDTRPVKYIVLGVEYPEDYPETVPILSVETSDGTFLKERKGEEDGEDDEEVHFEDELNNDDMKKLLDELDENAQENVGMASVFTLASLLKEQAEELYNEKVKKKEQAHEKAILAEEEKEQEKFRGTPVTPESFAEWRRKFREEFKLDQANEQRDKTKLTGREIFERGLNKDEDEDDLKEAMDELNVNK
ncbi:hypothetical protein TRICI_004291 [Trichomonascus ciferrii]|uniref:RWD domain-containing protein n=1 Tax=Trichomonascus ciferrii TaxID=44093 RepID=A0A642V6B7_9ASCO|nr:hypothetical protein TRICI_004291 [Trichomonascus ciferrii]